MPHLVSIVGPTAVGKTALSIKLARQYHTHIVSCDARQFYKYMDIGTAKPSQDELAAIPHHFIDYLQPDESITAGQFETAANDLLTSLFAEHEVVVSVGGSTLYNQAVWYGLDEVPAAAPEIREALNQKHRSEGLSPLLEELAAADPDTYQRIDRKNPARVIRALEVYRQTGKPISDFHTSPQNRPAKPYEFIAIGLYMDRELLYERINLRVDQMMDAGLEAEVLDLLGRGYPANSQALQSIGYREIIGYLSGEYDLSEAVRLIKRNSRRYAKRQLTWFRRDPNVHWFEAGQDNAVIAFLEKALIP